MLQKTNKPKQKEVEYLMLKSFLLCVTNINWFFIIKCFENVFKVQNSLTRFIQKKHFGINL